MSREDDDDEEVDDEGDVPKDCLFEALYLFEDGAAAGT